MNKVMKLILVAAVLVVTSGVANAQQYGIGRYERVQGLTNDLEDLTRALYLREQREWPNFRGNRFTQRVLYRLYNQAANFDNQVERNFRDRDRINLEYRRLVGTFRETQYTLNRVSSMGYLYRDLQMVSHLVNQIGRNLYAYGEQYRDDRYDRDYEDYDDYDDDYDHDDDYDDDYDGYEEYDD